MSTTLRVARKRKYIFAFGWILLFVSLYQLEIIYINLMQKQPYYLPFFLASFENLAFARDLWYSLLIASVLVIMLSYEKTLRLVRRR